MAQIHQGMATWQASGAQTFHAWWLALVADGYKEEGKPDEGLATLTEAFTRIEQTEERFYASELYRLKGELTLQKGTRAWRRGIGSPSSPTPSLKPHDPRTEEQEAEGYFLQAIEIAKKQQAKSWELRATTSLARLWQQQGKQAEAHQLLSDIYGWFTEGFDTKDLQEAKALLEELSQ
jgi:predicted ATPase